MLEELEELELEELEELEEEMLEKEKNEYNLTDIADISMGLVLARKKSNDKTDYKYNALTLKSFEEDFINCDYVEEFYSKEKLSEKYLAKKGNLIIRITEPFNSIYIDENSFINNKEKMTEILVSSSFAIITVKNIDFNPEYISVFLNSNYGKAQLRTIQNKYLINTIKIGDLENIKIKKIDKALQNKLCELKRIHLQEKNKINSLIQEKDKELNYILDLYLR